MTTKIVTLPVALAVSLEDARNAARVNGNDSDIEIAIFVRAITAEAEHLTGRAIINRTCRVTLDSFPVDGVAKPVCLGVTPIVAVLSLRYFDVDGIERTLDPADYLVDGASEPGWVSPAVGLAWPATQARLNAVNIDVLCGYGPDDTTTPDAFKGYILARVWERFAPAGTPESPYLIRSLDSLKVYS